MTDLTLFVGLDVHKKTISVAMVEATAGAEVRFYGTIANTPDAIRGLCKKLTKVAQQLAREEVLQRIERAEALCDRLKRAILELVPQWSLAPVVQAIQALRGVALIVASVIVAEVGCFSRFNSPRQLMAYLGLNPSEHSSGAMIRRGAITKTGNALARTCLVEAAWTYRV